MAKDPEPEAAQEPAEDEEEPFDPASVHRVFSSDAFNSAWELIEKEQRTEDEDEEMISLAHASAWHWTRRHDVRPKNLAISAWQLSRVYAEAGRFEEADRYARRSLAICQQDEVGPVFTGYAYEALARLAKATGELDTRDEWLALARAEAEKVGDKLDRNQLLSDLEEVT